jgi:hypothetical protein
MTRLHQLLPELVANFLLPWLCYRWAQPQWGETGLIVSSLPPIAWSVVELLRFRRIDALSLLVLGGILPSLLAMLLGGSPRVADARILAVRLDRPGIPAVTAVGKPLLFYLARATVARESARRRQRVLICAGRSRHSSWHPPADLWWGAG